MAIGDAEHNMEMTQLRQESYVDYRRCDLEFQVSEEVLFRIAPTACKLQHKLMGHVAIVCESVT